MPGQVHLGDSAHDVIDNSGWIRDHGGIAVFDDNRRHEHLDPESLRKRGYDHHGTPYAPCGRLCHANGDDYQAQSRQDVCGLPWPPNERQHGPHRFGVLGSSHRMSCKDHPRLIGPMQRGTPAWQRLYAARSASERTNSDNQEVIAKTHPLRMRGLKALRLAGAIRTFAQRLRRALHCVLDVTSTLGTVPLAQPEMMPFFDNHWMPPLNGHHLGGNDGESASAGKSRDGVCPTLKNVPSHGEC